MGGIPEMITDKFFDPYKEGDLEEKLLKFENNISNWKNKYEVIKQSAQKFLDYGG